MCLPGCTSQGTLNQRLRLNGFRIRTPLGINTRDSGTFFDRLEQKHFADNKTDYKRMTDGRRGEPESVATVHVQGKSRYR